MLRATTDLVERVPDEGQWFERGARVEFFEAKTHPWRRSLEPAALGSYEVLRCERQQADGKHWLAVTVRPFSFQ